MRIEYCERDLESEAQLSTQAKKLLKQEISFVDNREFRSSATEPILEQAISDAVAWKGKSATTLPTSAPLYRVCQQPLLSKQQEWELFFAMNALKFRANLLRASLDLANLNAKTVVDCKQNLQNAGIIRDMLICSNVRLVLSIVRDFQCAHFCNDELASDGIDALIRATEKFDMDKGFRFSTYATTVIGRHLGRIAKIESRRRTRFTNAHSESLDIFGSPETDNAEFKAMTKSSTTDLLLSMMQSLDDRERLILRRRFGFDPCESKPTLSRIANEFGVCRERVRQLENRALKKMRRLCNDGLSNEVKAELEPELSA